MSVWVEMSLRLSKLGGELVTLHVSVWVEMNVIFLITILKKSRSTWACELKCAEKVLSSFLARHAPRERVSWNFSDDEYRDYCDRHAPRERVSWNENVFNCLCNAYGVTLHVSVWVEIDSFERKSLAPLRHAPRERVSWNDLISCVQSPVLHVTLHVSVWVEMKNLLSRTELNKSRSTWACELKCKFLQFNRRKCKVTLHVSVWVEITLNCISNQNNHVTLHVSVWVEIPISITFSRFSVVTLHVSVWVEMIPQSQQERQLLSRSTWACELKYQCCDLVNDYMQSRSTWACELK